MAETIFAPATGPGRSAIALIRISGPLSHTCIADLTRNPLPPLRQMSVRRFHAPEGVILDEGMVVCFAVGASVTGEAMAEIHCHGGPAVVDALLNVLTGRPGCRLAQPGEFTRRAVLSGRLDLTEAEGIADLIAAETSLQREAAVRALSGEVSTTTDQWRRDLIHARAMIEATIDWADEEVPEDVGPEVMSLVSAIRESMAQELSVAGRVARLRDGLSVAIVGPPNAGKSTLLNAIAGRPAAIVSDTAGTTRDVLEVRCDLDGLPVTFLDTAGLRQTEDNVEREGVQRALARAGASDLRLHVRSPDTVPEMTDTGLWQADDLRVWAKSDLGSGEGDISVNKNMPDTISKLMSLVHDRLKDRVSTEGLLGVARRRDAAESALAGIDEALGALQAGDTEIAAEALRSATSGLDRLSGRLDVEDVLDEVFGTFCLGK